MIGEEDDLEALKEFDRRAAIFNHERLIQNAPELSRWKAFAEHVLREHKLPDRPGLYDADGQRLFDDDGQRTEALRRWECDAAAHQEHIRAGAPIDDPTHLSRVERLRYGNPRDLEQLAEHRGFSPDSQPALAARLLFSCVQLAQGVGDAAWQGRTFARAADLARQLQLRPDADYGQQRRRQVAELPVRSALRRAAAADEWKDEAQREAGAIWKNRPKLSATTVAEMIIDRLSLERGVRSVRDAIIDLKPA